MQNMQKNDDTGTSESESCSESSQGQTGGQNPNEQPMSSGDSTNMGNETFVGNGQNSYQGIPQNSINQTQQSPQQTFTGQSGSEPEAAGGQEGVQNAHDVPHYTSEGYILGRPQEANNPQTAGNIQGSSQAPLSGGFQGTAPGTYQQVPPQMQPQMQPQGFYNQVTPNPQPSIQPVYQQNPAQPVYQQTPPQPVYQQNPYNSQYPPPYPYEQQPSPAGVQPSEGEKRHGQIVDVVNGIIKGESPDIPKLISLFENIDTQFWKGAVIGAVLVLVATNDTVKKTIGNALSGVMGKASGAENEKGENNV